MRLAFLLVLFASVSPSGHALSSEGAGTKRILGDVARLAAPAWEGRRAGTPGADRAARWIAKEFGKIGLEPAGEGGSYFQTFSFIDGVDLGPRNRLSVSPDAHDWKLGSDYRPLAFSAPGSVSGEVVFAGYGIVAPDLQHDDYSGADVKGRIALVLRYGPGGDDPQSRFAAFTTLRMKAAAARDKGAVALLVVTGPRTSEARDDLVPLRADAALRDAGLAAVSIRRAVAEALFAGSGTTLDEAQRRTDEGKPAPFLVAGSGVRLTVDVTPRHSTTGNVVGLLRAAGEKGGEVVVIGAHYDHLGRGMAGSLDPSPDGKIHFGADDNASGVAGMLELARRFKSRHHALKRSLLFIAFAAEELGTLGSSHFVKNPTLPWSSISAMANMDMIGRLRENKLDVHGVGTSPAWRPLVDEASRLTGLQAKLHEGGYGPSDHSPFYAAGKPVLFVFTGSHPDYHRPSDTPERVSARGIERVVDFMEDVLEGVALQASPVPFVRVAQEKDSATSARSFRVWVGGIPDYSDPGPGVKFSGVSPGSPAEKAGMAAGDLLVRLGGKEIRDIYDYTYALSEYKAGDTVTAVVKRGASEVALTVTLGSRPGAVR